MLGPIRKFSTSIYAKILLGIIVIPFVFWGMGSSFRGGNKNVIVVINKEKFSTQEFVNFITSYQNANEKINSNKLDELLSVFIGNKLIINEYDHHGIKLSDSSLSKLIKIQKEFKDEKKFSRTKYEKFLITNNLEAVNFEKNLGEQEKKKQLLNFIGRGIVPPKFIVNNIYNKINQKRKIQLINLNDVYAKELAFSENEIESYYNKNKDRYIDIFKTVKFLEINPKNLIGTDEYTDIFFEKLDEIQDLIIQGERLDHIINKYNLAKPVNFKINKFGEDLNYNKINNFPNDLLDNTFLLSDGEPTAFIEEKNKFYIIETLKTENIQRELNTLAIVEDVKKNLSSIKKRKLTSNIMAKINQKTFLKTDFDTLSKNNNTPIQKITLENLNDYKILKEQIINQVYAYPEKKIILAHNIEFTENFLIYIDKIINVSINENSNDYEKYFKLSKIAMTNGIFNTYDNYIKKKYEIDINYKALTIVKNYFN